MNWNFLIPLGIIIVMSVLGYLMQMLKNATTKQQAERDRERSAARSRARERQPAARTPNRDLDRYQRAIDAQRAKPAPANKPVAARVVSAPPTVTPVQKPKLLDASTADFKTTKPVNSRSTTISTDDIPTAVVVATPKVAVVTKPVKAATAKPVAGVTVNPVTTQLQALLSNPNSLAVAVALQEVLGPPKCKRG
jgi:hypothetical protein